METTVKSIPSVMEQDRLFSQTFPGVQGINVWVSPLTEELAAAGLDRERLWLEVQWRLVRAGLPVPQEFDWRRTPRFPCLGLLVHADQAQVSPPFFIFSVEVFYVQKMSLAGDSGGNAMRMTWCREAVGDVREDRRGFDWSNLYNAVGSLVDQFIQDSLGVSATQDLPVARN